ncbi:DUF5681 domain-containing protein [Rhizorhabdus dicambivorans]
MGFRRIARVATPVVPSSPVRESLPPASDDKPQRAAEPVVHTEHADRSIAAQYKVGRGKPPVHTRWKKGQSGNPAGRKSGTRNSTTIALEIFGEVLTVQTPAGPKRMNTVALAYYKLRELVAKGDLKAIAAVVAIWQRVVPDPAPDVDVSEPPLSANEEAMLSSLLAQLGEAPNIKGRAIPGASVAEGDAA